MKLHFLGTCSGTEPMPTRKHMAFALESEGALYWFDAGEGCSHTAHLAGMDLLAVKTIVISHPHIDHVGGLANLLAVIRKLISVKKQPPAFSEINIYIPNLDTWDGICKILRGSEPRFFDRLPIRAVSISDGVVFDDGQVRVTAFHNHHLKDRDIEPWQSFTFRIECEGKRLVFSGDVGNYCEMDEAIGESCDGVIVETGHFGIDDARDYLTGKKIHRIFFSHNGREILNFPEQSRQKVENYFNHRGLICEDGMTVEL